MSLRKISSSDSDLSSLVVGKQVFDNVLTDGTISSENKIVLGVFHRRGGYKENVKRDPKKPAGVRDLNGQYTDVSHCIRNLGNSKMMPRELTVQFEKFWSLDDDIWISFDKRRKLDVEDLVEIMYSIHINVQEFFVIDVKICVGRALYLLRINSQRCSISLDKRSLSCPKFSTEEEVRVLRGNICGIYRQLGQ